VSSTKGADRGCKLHPGSRRSVGRSRQKAAAPARADVAFQGIRASSILNAIGSVVICLAPDHRILEWNSAASSVYGRSRDEVLGEDYLDLLIPEPARPRIANELKKVLSGEPTRAFENRVRGRDRKERILLWSLARLLDSRERPVGVVACGQDITPRTRARAHLKVSRAKLRDLSNHLNGVREEERASVARRVHDDLGQSLAALVLGLSRLEDDLREEPDPPRSDAVRELRSLAESTIEAANVISSSLRPPLLDDLGLEAAIAWEGRRFQDQSGIRCVCHLQRGIRDPEPTRQTAIFRIFRELLSNVSRHANASRVDVRLRHAQGWLILEVKDDGRGIRTSAIDGRRSLGILGMQERASFWEGEIAFRGVPAAGTTVTLRLPLVQARRPLRRPRVGGAVR